MVNNGASLLRGAHREDRCGQLCSPRSALRLQAFWGQTARREVPGIGIAVALFAAVHQAVWRWRCALKVLPTAMWR
ncbi:hypothetical protein ACTMS0_28895 [Micromonospora sp. H33]|uniref:hypothetical protein n=1 Tax=Micromonospora sp. H33 TaxID=3452215 RepID=UPI003F8A83ED